ncbi:MAG: L-serine ammonia-lyase, iron-sulfur-dependent, subunit alpha [Candidatus Gastranaerophilales bacterium]|nr:L-serine ammonia-lyase, iron-sulfur-dependent, subunit alpha [Candidatus Gastranaerophilales bacterium]
MSDTFFELKEKAEKEGLLNVITKREELNNKDFRKKVCKIANSMLETIQTGLISNELSLSGLCGFNTELLKNASVTPLVTPYIKKVMLFALATIEQNARMGKIAACPTAGSSGIVPAVLAAAKEEFNKTFDDFVNSLIVAGEAGRIISLKMQLAGAVGGCQAECGAASAMAAMGLGYMLNADIDTIYNAAALCIKNILGLTCDPVAGLVEVPCVKRNIFLSCHAVTSFYIAQSGIKSCIPLDETIDAMKETGLLMSPKLKESSEAGLALTKTGIGIKNNLYKLWHESAEKS